MNTENILIDCHQSFQFISGLGKAIFSSEIGKVRQKLGLLRLILPQFSKKINTLIKKATELQSYNILDIKKLQGDLLIK